MSIKGLRGVPAVKNWELNNIVGNLLYYKEALKVETSPEKREVLQVAFDKVQLNIRQYEIKMEY